MCLLAGAAPLPTGVCSGGCSPNLVGNGVCDDQCMNAACEWDGGDCLSVCSRTVQDGVESTCFESQLGDGSCDLECMNAECNYDYRDCECDTVLEERASYRSDGATSGSDYDNNQRLCWLVRPKVSGGIVRNISLSFRQFDTEAEYDQLRIFDGANVIAPSLSAGGLSGQLHAGALPKVTSHGKDMLITFRSDASVTESGFLFGWTSLVEGEDLPPGFCAWNCSDSMRGDGRCDEACMNAECGWDAALGATTGDCDRCPPAQTSAPHCRPLD